MIDLDRAVVLRSLLYLDSSAAFRIRRCCRCFQKLLAANSGLSFWKFLLEGSSGSAGSHSIVGGLWLHALVPEDILSFYAMHISTTDLADNLKFEDVMTVESLLKASCITPGIGAAGCEAERDQELIFGRAAAYAACGEGQQFFGSWVFNAKNVGAMICGKETGPVCSSLVEFCWTQGFCGRKFEVGVMLMVSRVAGDRFVLSWLPKVVTPGLLQEHHDCFEIHLHGHVATPSISPLCYEGSISTMSSPQAHDIPMELTLCTAGIIELLEQDSLICALTIHFHCMGDEALVTPTKGFDPTAQIGHWWPRRKFANSNGLFQQPPAMNTATELEDSDVESKQVSSVVLANHALCQCKWHGNARQFYCSNCYEARCQRSGKL
jgi:hypothetical protein